jgi:hypothetical protein
MHKMSDRSGIKNLWHGIRRLSRRQKILAGLVFLVVAATWLAVCVVFASLFV